MLKLITVVRLTLPFLLPPAPHITPIITNSQSVHSLEHATESPHVIHHEPPCDIAQNKGESPRQPTGISFPSRVFGSTKRSFQPLWYKH
jgi:hypothetical protein